MDPHTSDNNLPATKPKRGIVFRLFRFLTILVLVGLICIGALVGLLFLYQDEVKAAILAEINKHLNAEVRVDPKNIDLTIIKTFPDCSLEFRNILMLEALPVKKRDTLLFTERLNLHFNVKDLWNKNYHIDKISLQKGCAKPRILQDGSNNFTFWKENKQDKSENVHFKLEKVLISDLHVLYKDRQNLYKSEFTLRSLNLHGEFGGEVYAVESRTQLYLHQVVSGTRTLVKEKDVDLDLLLDVNNALYTVKRANLKVNNLALQLGGKFTYKDKFENAGIDFNAPDLDIEALLSLLPEQFRKHTADYKSNGDFYARGRFTYKNNKSYSFQSDFGIKSGMVTYKPNGTEARGIHLRGNIKLDPAYSHLILDEFNLLLGKDSVKGAITVRNFSDPFLDLSLNASVNLEELNKFWPIDTLKMLRGMLGIESRILGKVSDLKSHTFTDKVSVDLVANVRMLAVQFKGDDKTYAVEKCQLLAKEREVEVKDLKLKRGTSDMTLNGKMPGLFNYLVDRKAPLIIKGNMEASMIRLEDFIGDRKSSDTPNNEPLIPADISFMLDATISRFTFGKFSASDISGDIDVKNQKAIINEMKLQTMDGEARINVFADNSRKFLDVAVQSDLKNINIRKLFADMNNFGQNTLEDKNIRGIASATIDFSGRWTNDLQSVPESLKSSSDLVISRGELIGFKPLLSLSKFIDVKELEKISFSTLKGKVEIKNSAIVIPRTTINNSALNIEFWGTHYFNDNIDYHFQLLVSELLAKKRKKSDNEFGEVENDPENRRSAFVLMTGTLDNPVMKYDKQGLKEKIKNDLKQEKQNMRKILKDEFVTFRKEQDEEQPVRNAEPALETPSQKQKQAATLQLKKKEEEDDF